MLLPYSLENKSTPHLGHISTVEKVFFFFFLEGGGAYFREVTVLYNCKTAILIFSNLLYVDSLVQLGRMPLG